MYAWPVVLGPRSNREDYLETIALFDDDLNQPISLAGTTGAGTFSLWTVTDGAIVTASATTITIPPFPIGNQLSALPLTVGAGLGILPGDPIKIADASGKNTMTGYVISYAIATGALVVQIGMTFQFEIRAKGPWTWDSDYNPWYDVGAPTIDRPIITASLGKGIEIIDVGYIQIMIPELQFRVLRHKSYKVGLTMTDSVNTRQVMAAELPMIFGGVTN